MGKGVWRFVLLIWIVQVYLPVQVFAYQTEKKNILVIHSYNKGLYWTESITEGIHAVLDPYQKDIVLEWAYMDTKYNDYQGYNEQLYKLYKYKYKNRHFDAILTSDDDAFQFMLKYGQEVFPGVPFVFCGVNIFEEQMREEHPDFTGVIERIDLESTLDIAIKLHPERNTLLVLTDGTTTGTIVKEMVEKYKSYYDQKLKFEFYESMNLDEIEKKLKTMPEKTLIFVLTYFKQPEGGVISEKEAMQYLTNTYNFPVYSCWDIYMESGMVGGMLNRGFEQGRVAAEKILLVLKAGSAQDIPIGQSIPNQYMFDYNQMKRFGIKLTDLPPGSIIKGRKDFIYSIPKEQAWIYICVLIGLLVLIIGALSINIYKRKKAEETLRASEERYRKLVEILPVALIIHIDGILQYANEAAYKLLQVSRSEDIIGKSMWDFVHPDSVGVLTAYIEKFAQGIIQDPVETKVITGEGENIDVQSIVTLLPYKNQIGIMVVAIDITEQKKAAELKEKIKEKKRLLEEVQEYDRLKTEFFSNLSHEMRTPLNLIFSSIQLLELDFNRQVLDEKSIQKKIKILKQNSYRMIKLINNLIDISRIDAGYYEFNLQNMDIVLLVEDIVQSVAAYVEYKKIQLIFDTDIEEKIMACDPEKIERIILNLLSNAIKFTDRGGQIMVEICDGKDDIQIYVKDTGIGMELDQKELIFDRFRQVDKSFTRKQEGSGIGLSLVKSMVEMHKGSITVGSIYGQGSEFRITLPILVLQEDQIGEIQSQQRSSVEKINIEFSDIYEIMRSTL